MEAMNFCLQRRNFCFFFIPPARLEEDEAERKKNIRGVLRGFSHFDDLDGWFSCRGQLLLLIIILVHPRIILAYYNACNLKSVKSEAIMRQKKARP